MIFLPTKKDCSIPIWAYSAPGVLYLFLTIVDKARGISQRQIAL